MAKAATNATSTPAPVGFAPMPRGEGRYTRVNPNSKIAHAAAFRTVTLHTITEAFDLNAWESMWVGFHLDQILEPLMETLPHTVPLAVRQEMLDETYTRLLELRDRPAVRYTGQKASKSASLLAATADEWADVITDQIVSCYTLRPLVEDGIRGSIVGLLRELGVGDTKNPRSAVFLPNDLRVRLVADRNR